MKKGFWLYLGLFVIGAFLLLGGGAQAQSITIDTGTDHSSPVDDTVVTPTANACSGCHDGTVAAAHMEQNGASFGTSQAAIDSGEVIEQCEVCHSPGRSADVSIAHGLD